MDLLINFLSFPQYARQHSTFDSRNIFMYYSFHCQIFCSISPLQLTGNSSALNSRRLSWQSGFHANRIVSQRKPPGFVFSVMCNTADTMLSFSFSIFDRCIMYYTYLRRSTENALITTGICKGRG